MSIPTSTSMQTGLFILIHTLIHTHMQIQIAQSIHMHIYMMTAQCIHILMPMVQCIHTAMAMQQHPHQKRLWLCSHICSATTAITQKNYMISATALTKSQATSFMMQ